MSMQRERNVFALLRVILYLIINLGDSRVVERIKIEVSNDLVGCCWKTLNVDFLFLQTWNLKAC